MLDLLASLFTIKALLAAVVLVLVMEYISLKRKRQSLPGPKYWLPFLGKTIEMVSDPVHFYHTYQTNFGPISWTQLMGKFVVFTTDTELTRKVFTNTAGKLRLFLVFTAEKILGKNNIAFMHGPEHKELRKQLLPLFTPKALKVYLNLQEDIIRATLARWAKELQGTTQEIRTRVRDLNVETSTKVFLGKYMNDEQRAGFNVDYGMLNEGMMSLPIELPGTTYWKAIQARKKIVKMLTSCVVQSKAAMKDKNAPHCLLDFWMEEQMRLIDESQLNKEPLPTHTSDYEIACVVLDFLFASQDASTASLVWTFHLTDRHPEVLKRVRQEQQLVRPNDEPLTHELIKEMGYTRQVVKEILRFRPPASMVPHIAVDDFKISDDYTVPKGTIILPSVWAAQMEGYTKPESFDPDRFSDARAEEVKFGKHWLVFGTGAHMCLGKEYAMNHLTAFLAILASNYTWKCERTPLSEEVVFGPTIFPADGCVLSLTA